MLAVHKWSDTNGTYSFEDLSEPYWDPTLMFQFYDAFETRSKLFTKIVRYFKSDERQITTQLKICWLCHVAFLLAKLLSATKFLYQTNCFKTSVILVFLGLCLFSVIIDNKKLISLTYLCNVSRSKWNIANWKQIHSPLIKTKFLSSFGAHSHLEY